jgi:hypothetical protein
MERRMLWWIVGAVFGLPLLALIVLNIAAIPAMKDPRIHD